jgi:hypothetical protein
MAHANSQRGLRLARHREASYNTAQKFAMAPGRHKSSSRHLVNPQSLAVLAFLGRRSPFTCAVDVTRIVPFGEA